MSEEWEKYKDIIELDRPKSRIRRRGYKNY